MKNITLGGLLVVGFMSITSSQAAVISSAVISDLPAATGAFAVERQLGVSISGDSAVYMVGTMNLVSTISSLGSSFMEANLSEGTTFNTGFGNGFGGNSIVIASDGTQASATETFSQGVPMQFVIKLNQTNGDATLWVNPDLNTAEGLNTASATATIAKVNGSTFDSIVFRGGDFDAEANTIDFTDFSVYYGGDSPFVPEPSSALLLSMAGLVLARRRR